MANSYKAQAVAAELFDRLSLRCAAAGLAIAQSADTDGNPLIKVGAGSNGGQNAIIKILPQTWPLAKDVLGNTALQYVPTMAQIATEASATSGVTLVTAANLAYLLGELMSRSLRTEWYFSANGAAPTASTFGTASNLKATYDPSLYNPLTGAGQ